MLHTYIWWNDYHRQGNWHIHHCTELPSVYMVSALKDLFFSKFQDSVIHIRSQHLFIPLNWGFVPFDQPLPVLLPLPHPTAAVLVCACRRAAFLRFPVLVRPLSIFLCLAQCPLDSSTSLQMTGSPTLWGFHSNPLFVCPTFALFCHLLGHQTFRWTP